MGSPRIAAAGWAATITFALAGAPPVLAQTRGSSPAERERTAVEMCSRELNDRESGRGVHVERTIRSDYRKDKVYWDGYMNVRRNGPDRTVRVSCVVAFDGKNRIVSFDSSGGGSSGGGGDDATRACRKEADRRGYDISGTGETVEAGRLGRVVTLRTRRDGELLCVYRGRASLYRPV